MFSMDDDWLLVALVCAVPFVLFGLFEGVGMMRRRAARARASRSKG